MLVPTSTGLLQKCNFLLIFIRGLRGPYGKGRGGDTVLKVGGGKFCERSEQKIFFDPPLFGHWGGDKILLR